MDLPISSPWQQVQHILELLSSLSYRTEEIGRYLHDLACGVSDLLALDWSVVTLCRGNEERVMASSLDLGEGDHIYDLHGILTGTVFKTGQTLTVEDATIRPEYGKPPEGYRSYLGIPLRNSEGIVIGTLCSFCVQPRLFQLEEVHTAELFAERAAIALDNYFLYQKQQEFNQFLEAEVAKRTAELEAAHAQLIEKERLAAIGEFAAMIVHEIRNPVTTILMGLNYFYKQALSERDRLRASLALDEAQRLQNLLGEILLFAKPHVLQSQVIEINQLIEGMLPTLQEMPEAEGRQIDFIPASIPITFSGDTDKIKQVMINLIRNACEAIKPDEIVTCRVELYPELAQVCISIHNYGTPIPPEIVPKLTQPFCSSKSGGTGLGLAIVKRIIDAHHGSFSIQSNATTGTTAKISLPVNI